MNDIPSKAVISRKLAKFRAVLDNSKTCEDALAVGAGVAGIEEMMERAGFYQIEEIRPVRELWLDSRWVLGGMLRKMIRGKPGPKKVMSRPETQFRTEIERLGLNKDRAVEAQRINTLPVKEKIKAYAEAKQQEILPTIAMLIDVARPWWYQASRKDKHDAIRRAALAQVMPEQIGPFPLIYADPPWKFQTYSEAGLAKTPDQHYPTLTDDEICNFTICGKRIEEIATDTAALLMWCTSSNIHRALAVMQHWGFEYKSQAIWVKTRNAVPIAGLGLVFRNMHEILLYGTRGAMPGPQYQPPSVFFYERGRHSAKPPEIRTEIEKMYPDFDDQTRLEIFSRDHADGWTHYGFETLSQAAE